MSRRSRRTSSHSTTLPTSSHPTTVASSPPTSLWQKTLIWLFYVLVLTVPFFFTWVNEELFEFNKLMLTYGVVVLIMASWLLRMAFEGRVILHRTWFDIPIALFVVSQIVSTVFSIHVPTSIFGYYTRFHGGLLSTFTYVALYYAFVSNVEKKHVPYFFVAAFAAALGVTIYAIPEHFGMSPSCVLIAGDWNVSCWIQDVQNRVFATFGQPNWLAAYAITLIPVGISLSLMRLPTWRRAFFAITTLLLFVTLLFTKSRSGLLGFGVSMLMYLALFIHVKPQAVIHHTRSVLLLGFLMSFGVLWLIFGTPWTPSLLERTQGEVQESIAQKSATPEVNRLDVGGTESGEIRKIVWEGAFRVWQRYPLFGSGVETFAYSYYQDRPVTHNVVSEWDFLYNKAHNEFLNYLATTGILGFLTYTLLVGSFIVYPLVMVFRVDHPAPSVSTQILYLGVATGLIALSISNALGFSTVMVSLLFFLYPAIVVVWQKGDTPPAEVTHNQTLHVITSITVGIAALYCIAGLMAFWRADRLLAAGKQYDKAGQLAEAIHYLTEAISLAPHEALYYDELSNTYARAAVVLAEQGQATQSAQIAQAALQNSSKALELNPRHLNFYKTRARVLITLAQLNPELLKEAQTTLESAIALSPTDAKLYYNLAIVQLSLGDTEQGLATFEKTVTLKPNYEAARYQLGQQYEDAEQPDQALEQYRYILDNINPNNETVKEALERHTTQ